MGSLVASCFLSPSLHLSPRYRGGVCVLELFLPLVSPPLLHLLSSAGGVRPLRLFLLIPFMCIPGAGSVWLLDPSPLGVSLFIASVQPFGSFPSSARVICFFSFVSLFLASFHSFFLLRHFRFQWFSLFAYLIQFGASTSLHLLCLLQLRLCLGRTLRVICVPGLIASGSPAALLKGCAAQGLLCVRAVLCRRFFVLLYSGRRWQKFQR